jgi:amino acid transporter
MTDTTAGSRGAAVDVDGDTRLRQLGYAPRLERGLTTTGSVILTLSDITPAGSLLVVGIAVVAIAGTGSVIAYLAGAGLAIMVALCMAELGSLFPIAGGIYAIVARVLGTWASFLTLLSYVVQAVFLPASIALGVGTYLNSLNSSIPVNLTSAIAMIVVTGLALLRIHVNALMTAIFLLLEMVVIVVIALAGFSSPAQSVSSFLHPQGLVNGSWCRSPPEPSSPRSPSRCSR